MNLYTTLNNYISSKISEINISHDIEELSVLIKTIKDSKKYEKMQSKILQCEERKDTLLVRNEQLKKELITIIMTSDEDDLYYDEELVLYSYLEVCFKQKTNQKVRITSNNYIIIEYLYYKVN